MTVRWTDRRLATLREPGDGINQSPLSLTEEVEEENRRQLEKWGAQTHTPAEWFLIMVEELGELGKEVCSAHFDSSMNVPAIRREAIQFATVALKIAEMAEFP